MEKILFIGSSWVFAKYMSTACSGLGYEAVFFGDMNFYSKSVQNKIKECRYYQVDINSVEDMYALIQAKDIKNIAGVISSADSKLKNAILLDQKIKNCKYPDPAIFKLTDKYEVSKLLPEYSPEGMFFSKHNIPHKTLQDLFYKYKKLFIKPSKYSERFCISSSECIVFMPVPPEP